MTLNRYSLLFAAGVVGGLANVVAITAAGGYGLPAPPVSLAFLYKQLTWGGLWGLAFLIPLFPGSWWKKGMAIGVLPSLLVLLYFLPKAGAGFFGLNRGPLVLLLVLFFNVIIWGLASAYWAKRTGSIDAA